MDKISQLKAFCLQRNIKAVENVPLKTYCTFKIGGPADLLVEPDSREKLGDLLHFVGEAEVPHIILGRGSNLLIADEGFQGVAIHLGSNFSYIKMRDETRVECGCGVSLTELCRFALSKGLTGLEFAFGIPGTVGGAVYMNAGAYGGEIKDVLEQAMHLDFNGQQGYMQRADMEMGYRHSAYTDSDLVITSAVFALSVGNSEEIKARMDDFMGRRKEKQPLEFPSAGSTFKRPEGAYASALIDQCGLKGKRIGGAAVSEKHAGFIVNLDGATCEDVKRLIAFVQKDVERKTGYQLECEVKMLG